jgi:hypothetical protein
VSCRKEKVNREKEGTDDFAVAACVIAMAEGLLEWRARKETGSRAREGDALMGVEDCSEPYIAGVDERPQDGNHTVE